MSNGPDELVERAEELADWAERVEAHLDAHPLPVDEATVQAAAARLEARLGTPRRSRRLVPALLGGLLAAALAWAVLRPRPPDVAMTPTPNSAPTLRATAPEAPPVAVHLEEPARSVVVDPGSAVWTQEIDHSAVMLVREGRVEVGGEVYPSGTWLLLGRRADGESVTVAFPDGEAPPDLEPDTWPRPAVDAALRRIRWRSLPDRTTDTLRHLLEEPP